MTAVGRTRGPAARAAERASTSHCQAIMKLGEELGCSSRSHLPDVGRINSRWQWSVAHGPSCRPQGPGIYGVERTRNAVQRAAVMGVNTWACAEPMRGPA